MKVVLSEDDYNRINETEKQQNLLQLINNWLERMPFFEEQFWKNYKSLMLKMNRTCLLE